MDGSSADRGPNMEQTRAAVFAQDFSAIWAAGASSSGVEQSFAQAAKLTELLQVDSHVGDVMEARLW